MTGRGAMFEKWEGLGNDFVIVADEPEGTLAALSDEEVRRLSDRRLGVGADGVLVVVGARSPRPRMIVRNADGSRPEMCGNGLRCVAGWLAERAGARELELRVATDAGDRRCAVTRLDAGRYDVTIDMGVARFAEDLVVDVDGQRRTFASVDVGNPHAISFEPADEATIDRVGPRVASAPAGGTNVEFCRVLEGGGIGVVVWERGVGRTLACGTGACAVAAAACARGLAAYGAPTRIVLPGGPLDVTVAQGSREVTMRGPARRAFAGEVVVA